MALAIPTEAISICRKWEGYHTKLPDGRAKPYVCPGGVITCGIGTTVWPDGRKVSMRDDPITLQYAEFCLRTDLERRYAPTVDRVIKVPLHPYMRAALISLTYNIGSAAFAKSTLARRINARDWAAVPAAFKMWRNGGGRVLTGLLNRRIDEAALFMRGVAALSAAPAPSSIPAVPMPTRPADAARVTKGPSWWDQIVDGILQGLGGRAGPVPA